MPPKKIIVIVILFVVAVAVWQFFMRDRGGDFRFDPVAIASTETNLWKAYYGGSKQELAKGLVDLLREQFGLSMRAAILAAQELAAATWAFQRSQGDYEQRVLPVLEKAYTRIKSSAGGDWDPKEVARAELSWWVARRTPGRNHPEQVGAEIARMYAILYGSTNPQIEEAGYLRAEAAAMRDQGAPAPDWNTIQRMLEESYTALVAGTGE